MMVTQDEAIRIAQDAHRQGKKIVTTNGCFDLLHIGHITYLAQARKLGDLLIVGVNSDQSPGVTAKPGRPIVPGEERAKVIAALKSVDYAFLFDDPTPIPWVAKIKPHVHVKSADVSYGLEQCVERNAVEENGGTVVLLPKVPGRSTTGIVEKIRKQ